MPLRSRSHGSLHSSAARINDRIRRLMDSPDSEQRAEEYGRLLVEWDQATRAATRRGPAWVPRPRGLVRPSSSKDGVTVPTPPDSARGQARASRCRSGCALA
ncbi:hypothetical protein [[Kitasatospora] papulosa]|uniref:hypothetical protein n=1 Tax=[Kitasatospora] papulosa TaxID=1464011 RepID=UPI0036A409E2